MWSIYRVKPEGCITDEELDDILNGEHDSGTTDEHEFVDPDNWSEEDDQ